jgi:hypothetical protein
MSSVVPIQASVVFSECGPGEQLTDTDGLNVQLPPKPVGEVTPPLPVKSVTVTAGAFGSIGGADVVTAISAQPFGDFFTSCRKHPFVGVEVSVAGSNATLNNPDTTGGEPVPLFTGYVDEPGYTLELDDLAIPCRDMASMILEGDISAIAQQSTPILEIVQEIAAQMGDTTGPLISTAQVMTQTFGTLLARTASHVEHRISGWAFLQKLAKLLGYVVYPTPTGLLYFGPRARTDLSPLTLVWGGANAPSDLLTCHIQHTPARNGMFHVQVASHDPSSGANIQRTATYVNPDQAAFGKWPNPTLAQGLTLSQVKTTLHQIQVYNFFAEGASSAAAANEALGHALDIQAHEIVITCTMPGNTRLQVGQPLLFQGTGIGQVDHGSFFVAGVHHRVEVSEGDESPGFVTRFVAWQASPPGVSQ